MKRLFSIICLIAGCFSAQAQTYSYTGTTTGNVTISQVISFSVTNLSGTVSFATYSSYTSGITVNNYATIAIKSNVPWVISLSAPATFTATGGGASTNMPSSILGIRIDGQGTGFYAVNQSGLSTTGNAGNTSTSGNTFNTDLNFNPGFGYNGGNYSISLLYTLTHQ